MVGIRRSTPHSGTVWAIFPFAPVGNTEILFWFRGRTRKRVCVCGSGTRERERERESAREHLKGFIMIQSSYIGAFDNTKLDFDVYHVLGSMEGDHGLAIHDLGFRV